MLELIFTTYLLATVILCFARIRIGVAMFLFYSLLVPFLKFFTFGQNIFPFLILISLFFNYGLKKIIYKPLLPFLFLYLALFCIIPFHNDVPYLDQINMFRIEFMSTMLLPFAMINVMNKDKKAVSWFSGTLLIAIIIATIYSLFLITIPGINPYLMTVMPLSGGEFLDSYALTENDGRLFGRISGVFSHPMTNGLFLCLASIFILSNIDFNKILKQKTKIFLFFIVLLAIIFIGVRTAIAAIVAGIAVYLLLERRVKLIFYFLAMIVVLIIISQQIPGMEDYFSSVVDPNSAKVVGSSTNMRIDQFNGCLKEINSNYLFGKGYLWTQYYKELHGDHPVMLAFESLILVILCNNGIVGALIWVVMLIIYIKTVYKQIIFSKAHLMLALMATYFIYAIITGEYGYMKYFIIFYVLIYADGKNAIAQNQSSQIWIKKHV